MDYHEFNEDSSTPNECIVCGETRDWVEHTDDAPEWPIPAWTNVGEFDMERFALGE